MTRHQHLLFLLYTRDIDAPNAVQLSGTGIAKDLLFALKTIEISSHVIRYENNQFHLFRRGPASEGQTVDGLLNELNGRRIVMTEEQFENWMNEEI